MGFRTIVLKLHKPSAVKCDLIDEAVRNYNNAFQFLLHQARMELNSIQQAFEDKNGLFHAASLSKWVHGARSKALNQFAVQPFKDSLKLEFGLALADCLNRGAVRNFPTGEKPRPIYFCRYDIKRSYSLLYDGQNDRFYAKLYLLNAKNGLPKMSKDSGSVKLKYIWKEDNLLETAQGKSTFIIVPLSFGKYQERFLKTALGKPESLKTAKLFQRGNAYFLAVNMETEDEKKILPETYLGVTRGLKNNFRYTVVNKNGEAIEDGAILLSFTEKGAVPIQELHKATKRVVETALNYHSQVIVQNLSGKSDGIGWAMEETESPAVCKRNDYMSFAKILAYKLPARGLPMPVKVSSVDIFCRCSFCGVVARKNRFHHGIFICTKCGCAMEGEKLGSLNLSRKLLLYHQSKIRIKVKKTPQGTSFENRLIGLNCFIPYDDNQLERLQEELQNIFERMKCQIQTSDVKEKNKIYSILLKLESTDNIQNLLEFV